MSEPIIVVELLSSNGKALPDFLDLLSLFLLAGPKGFSSVSAEIPFFFVCFLLCLTTGYSNKSQLCQTCEGITLGKL